MDKLKMGDNLRIGIGDMSKMTGVSSRQLRYWEQKGYIKAMNEEEGVARKYGLGSMYKIFAIKHFLDEGYTLAKAVEKAELHRKEGILLHRVFRTLIKGIELMDETEIKGRVDLGTADSYHVYGVVDENGTRIELEKE